MSATAALSRTYRIGKRYTVTFACPPIQRGAVLCMSAEWTPDVPASLSRREQRDYERAREQFIFEIAGGGE